MGMEAHLAIMGRGAVDSRRARLHGRRGVALPVRSVGIFVADVVCHRWQTICGCRGGVGPVHIWLAVRTAGSHSRGEFVKSSVKVLLNRFASAFAVTGLVLVER